MRLTRLGARGGFKGAIQWSRPRRTTVAPWRVTSRVTSCLHSRATAELGSGELRPGELRSGELRSGELRSNELRVALSRELDRSLVPRAAHCARRTGCGDFLGSI